MSASLNRYTGTHRDRKDAARVARRQMDREEIAQAIGGAFWIDLDRLTDEVNSALDGFTRTVHCPHLNRREQHGRPAR